MLIFAKKIIASAGIIVPVAIGVLCNNVFVNAEMLDGAELNEDYLKYLSLSDEEKANIDVIPNMYNLKADVGTVRDILNGGKGQVGRFDEIVNDEQLPTRFDLRDVNGKSFITPLKDQGGTGICWSFATMEQAESLVMTSTNTSFNADTVVLSPRQMDYANSNDGIKNYSNENGMRGLLKGGNFFMSSLTAMNGVSMVPESVMPFDESTNKKELAEVLNYQNSEYEIENTVMMPSLGPQYNDLYVKAIKELVMSYGGAYLGTGSPQGSCAARNIDGSIVLLQESDCENNADFGKHAMQIIGWDDDYNYSYCKNNSKHERIVNGSCSGGTLVSGSGAWIVRNSWGDDSLYKYIYVAFDSDGLDVNFISGLASMEGKEWDNNYHYNVYKLETPKYGNEKSSEFTKKISGGEKIKKIKFMTLASGQDYTISISSASKNYENIAHVSVMWPGIHTVYLSDSDVVIEDDKFTVTIKSAKGQILDDTISVFTENIDKTPIISTADVVTADDILDNGDYSVILYSDTKNIPSGSTIDYKLMKDGVDYSQYLNVANNTVAINNVNATITIDDAADYGEYTIVASYNDKTYESKITLSTALKVYFATNNLIERRDNVIIYNGANYNDLLSLISTNASSPVYTHYNKDLAVLDGETIKTSDILEIKLSEKVKNYYTIVVLGDINSDSKVSSADYIKIRKHIMETETISPGIYYYAADVNKDNSISSADYIKIRKYIMNGGTL